MTLSTIGEAVISYIWRWVELQPVHKRKEQLVDGSTAGSAQLDQWCCVGAQRRCTRTLGRRLNRK